ncbi:hypothetical protein, partial [Ralstonia pseudosolanacearum]|uniref:hypothetical protein n=1 Tax=Ralstonia pseudosolanacearum TaxID=1310165 RepID=UPI001E655993
AKVENLRSQPGCLQRYLSGPLHVNVSSPRGAAGLCNNAAHRHTVHYASPNKKAKSFTQIRNKKPKTKQNKIHQKNSKHTYKHFRMRY